MQPLRFLGICVCALVVPLCWVSCQQVSSSAARLRFPPGPVGGDEWIKAMVGDELTSGWFKDQHLGATDSKTLRVRQPLAMVNTGWHWSATATKLTLESTFKPDEFVYAVEVNQQHVQTVHLEIEKSGQLQPGLISTGEGSNDDIGRALDWLEAKGHLPGGTYVVWLLPLETTMGGGVGITELIWLKADRDGPDFVCPIISGIGGLEIQKLYSVPEFSAIYRYWYEVTHGQPH